MPKNRNHNPKRIQYDKLYTKYLQEASARGQFTPQDVKFWSEVNSKAKKNPAYSPFTYLHRTHYRIDQRFNS